jgi:hypothetical protein
MVCRNFCQSHSKNCDSCRLRNIHKLNPPKRCHSYYWKLHHACRWYNVVIFVTQFTSVKKHLYVTLISWSCDCAFLTERINMDIGKFRTLLNFAEGCVFSTGFGSRICWYLFIDVVIKHKLYFITDVPVFVPFLARILWQLFAYFLSQIPVTYKTWVLNEV